MGSCNSTALETSNSKLKANLKKNKKIFHSKKLRNLKENIENKFNKNVLPFPLIRETFVKSEQHLDINRNSSGDLSDNDSFRVNERSFGVEQYDNSSIVHLQFEENKRASQASSDQFPLIDRDSIVNLDSYEIITEISVSMNQATSSAIHQMANFGSSSIPTNVNNPQRPASSAPISRFGFKPVVSNASLPISSVAQLNNSSKPSQNLLQVISFQK